MQEQSNQSTHITFYIYVLYGLCSLSVQLCAQRAHTHMKHSSFAQKLKEHEATTKDNMYEQQEQSKAEHCELMHFNGLML